MRKVLSRVAVSSGAWVAGFMLAFPVVGLADTDSAVTAPSVSTAGAGGDALTEIVVTATRRSTTAQEIPEAITAISGSDLRALNIVNPEDLTGLAPGLNVDQGLGNGQTHISLRGLASTEFSLGATSPIALYLDDVYQPFEYGTSTQIYDLNRIEVLRGPQGTLFGKNATGGAVLYYSQAPTQKEEGYIDLDGGGGEYRHYAAEGALNEPFGDGLAARLSFRVTRRDDYIDNLSPGSIYPMLGAYTNYNARLQLAWTPSDRTSVSLKLFGVENRGDPPTYIGKYLANPCAQGFVYATYFMCNAAGQPAPQSGSPVAVYDEVNPQYENYTSAGATLKIEQRLGDYALTAITGAQQVHYRNATNDDGTGADFFHSQLQSAVYQLSQEVRLASPQDSALKGVVGVFADYEHILAQQGSVSDELDPALGFDYADVNYAEQGDTSFAAFGNATYDFNPYFSFVSGLRFSSEHKDIDARVLSLNVVPLTNADLLYTYAVANNVVNPAFGDVLELDAGHHTWQRATWDETLNYKPVQDVLVYGKVATGFRSGGYPVGTATPGTFSQLSPETLITYEVGSKTEWLDKRLRVNVAAYYTDYENLQVQTVNTHGPGLILSNAATSHIKGVEWEADALLLPGLRVNANAAYLDAKYVNYETDQFGIPKNLAGNPLPYSPKINATLGANYVVPLQDYKVIIDTNWTYRSAIYFDSNAFAEVGDPARVDGTAQIGFAPTLERWKISAYVDNVTNHLSRNFAYINANGTLPFEAIDIYNPLRTWGLKLSLKF